MEKQSFELTRRMNQYATVHLLCWDGSESKIRFFRKMKGRIRAMLRQFPGISILHFNDGLAAAFCSGANDFPELQRTVTLHGLDVVFPNAFFQRRILPRFSYFQSIIAVSQATARACMQRGIPAEKIIVIPNGVDHDIASYVPEKKAREAFLQTYQSLFEGKKVLIMMGRPVLRKGFSWFLQSVLPALPPDFHVLIIGPFHERRPMTTTLLHLLPGGFRKQLELLFGLPSDEDTLRTVIRSPQLRERVTHLGKLPFTDIMQIMSAGYAFVMPNIPVPGDMEGFGLVCLEANLRQLPVVAARLEGITDAIQDQKNGWLLPAQESATWVSMLNKLHQDPAMVAGLGTQARQYVLDNFGWDTMTTAYYAHFETLRIRREQTI